MVTLLTSDRKTSNTLEVHYDATGMSHAKEKERKCALSLTDRIQMKSNVEQYHRPDTGSNHCKKTKEKSVEKVENEGRDAFRHEHLKTTQ